MAIGNVCEALLRTGTIEHGMKGDAFLVISGQYLVFGLSHALGPDLEAASRGGEDGVQAVDRCPRRGAALVIIAGAFAAGGAAGDEAATGR